MTNIKGNGEGKILNKATILIVEDNELNRDVFRALIKALGYTPILAENGVSALSQMEKLLPDLVLLDILMPEMNGYEVLERMKGSKNLRYIPVIMISSLDEMESVVRCIEGGADDYLVKPFDYTLLKARINTCLEKKYLRDREEKYRKQIEDYNLNLEDRVQKQVKDITAAQHATIFALAKLAASRDKETGEHLQRICEYCKTLSEKLRLLPKYESIINEAFIRNIYAAAPLHDIGKVGIPDRILLKPGKLTDEEYAIMKTHPTIGAETLREVNQQYPGNDFVRIGIEMVETHHERWNGKGYPHGISGEDIPLVGRILSLADYYDAQTSKRIYKEAFPHARSRETIINSSGKHFDPDVVDAFISAEDKFIAISKCHIDTEDIKTPLMKK